MTCRHGPNDLDCSSNPFSREVRRQQGETQRLQGEIQRLQGEIQRLLKQAEVDSKDYTIVTVREMGEFLILQVRYPSCANCEFEGLKTMVFKATVLDALRWKQIDPHFRADAGSDPTKAPSPIARFPGTSVGMGLAEFFVTKLLQT